MSEVPKEIRCDFDAEKVCPLRAAVNAVEQVTGTPETERMSTEEFDGTLQAAAAMLSKFDLGRFYAMTDPQGAKQGIREGTCNIGPSRWMPLIGKLSCGSAIVNYVRRGSSRKPAGTERSQPSET
ncbi:MAG: hypothetical protein ACREJM_15395 [Candidatus Saccharimonadales bacterium]